VLGSGAAKGTPRIIAPKSTDARSGKAAVNIPIRVRTEVGIQPYISCEAGKREAIGIDREPVAVKLVGPRSHYAIVAFKISLREPVPGAWLDSRLVLISELPGIARRVDSDSNMEAPKECDGVPRIA
jgi:hypothetical protein